MRNFKNSNYPRDWYPAGPSFYAFDIMHSGKWLQEHEALAAIIFVTLSITLTAFFAWLEQRLFHKGPR